MRPYFASNLPHSCPPLALSMAESQTTGVDEVQAERDAVTRAAVRLWRALERDLSEEETIIALEAFDRVVRRYLRAAAGRALAELED